MEVLQTFLRKLPEACLKGWGGALVSYPPKVQNQLTGAAASGAKDRGGGASLRDFRFDSIATRRQHQERTEPSMIWLACQNCSNGWTGMCPPPRQVARSPRVRIRILAISKLPADTPSAFGLAYSSLLCFGVDHLAFTPGGTLTLWLTLLPPCKW